jgi:Ca2+-binding EF-hand superfamily protein
MKALRTLVSLSWIALLMTGCQNSQTPQAKNGGVVGSEEKESPASGPLEASSPSPTLGQPVVAIGDSASAQPESSGAQEEKQKTESKETEPETGVMATRIPIGWVDLGSPERLDLLLIIDGMPIDRYRRKVEEEVASWFDSDPSVPLTWTKALEHPFGTLVQSWLIVTAGVAEDATPDQMTLMERYDENENELAEPRELVRWMSRGLVRDTPVTLQHANASTRSQRQNSQVFRALDRNADGTIDPKEVSNAAAGLSVLDANGDRVIDPSDLLFLRESAVAVDRQRDRSLPSDWYLLESTNARRDFLELLQGSDWTVMCERSEVWKSLLSLYEAWEERPDRKSVSALAQAVIDQPADLHLEMKITNRWGNEPSQDVAHATTHAADSPVSWSGGSRWQITGLAVRQSAQSHLLLEFRDSLSWSRQEALVQRLADRLGVSRDRAIEVVSGIGGATVERNFNDLIAGPSPGLFDLDRDGKVSWKELELAVRRMATVASAQFVIRVVEVPDLAMVMLDRDGDGRVSEREIGESATFLKEYADSLGIGATGITGDHLPLLRRLILERRSPLEGGDGMAAQAGYRLNEPKEALSDGWFAAMDSNQDGVISPREFLGPTDSWKQWDRDEDGWIEWDEVESKQ